MILVLEGPEGTGKTTLARSLVERHQFLTYRPMSHGGRLPADTLQQWHEDGVPVNRYPEDAFTADLLWKMHDAGRDVTRIILDRSMPSGVAYAEGMSEDTAQRLMSFWCRRMSDMGAVVVHLDASNGAIMSRLSRNDPRRHPKHLAMVRDGLARALRYCANLRVIRINTTGFMPNDTLDAVERALSLPRTV